LEKTFLFLQGPHSFFYQRLAGQLEALGHKCLRIHLCFSDWFFWQRSGGSNYRGTLVNWEAFLAGYLDNKGVTDIVLLGEQRDYHKVAVDLAKLRGIRVTVTEWGYLRPDWITFERQGMSGNSLFTRDPVEILRLGENLPEPDFIQRHRERFPLMAAQGLIGDWGNALLFFLYPGYVSHLSANPFALYLSTGLKRWKNRSQLVRNRRIIHRWVAKPRRHPLFVLPMQIEADYQVRAYSKYPDLVTMLEEVVDSFGRHSPQECRLMIKLHPMDPGFRAWGRIIARAAAKSGASDRVVFVENGSFEFLVKRCAGVVTVNSTAGVTAIKAGKPVKTLGKAVYDVPGLTFQGPLDHFWRNPGRPDKSLCKAYIKLMAACIQVKGGFFSESGLAAAVEGAAKRLHEELVNKPLLQLE
jgi:capsular polysaccharide export protein